MSDTFVEILKRNYMRMSVPQDAETTLGCERKVLAVLVVAEEKGAIVIVIQCLPDPVQVPFKNPLFGNVPIVSDYAARCRWCREEAL